MVEREGQSPGQPMQTLAAAFECDPEPLADEAFGTGVRLKLTEAGHALDVFSDEAVVRISAPSLELTLHAVDQLEVSDSEAVLWTMPDDEPGYEARISRDGALSLRSPATGPTKPRSRERTSERANVQENRRQRTEFTGRLGSEVSFRTTPKGVSVARFPVAVRGEDGQTTWETVIVFGERAETARDSLQRGDAVDIVGYVNQRTTTRRDGTQRLTREIYAAVVTPR